VSLLGRMVGSRLSSEEAADDILGQVSIPLTATISGETPAPAAARSPARALGHAARAAAPYGLAVGGTAAVSAIAGAPDWFTLMAMGGCAAHAGRNAAEGLLYRSKGGRFFEKRRRRYQGEAGLLDVRGSLSVRTARKKMARLAPLLPPAQAHIVLGTSLHRPAQIVAVSRAESILVVAPPQTLKTAFISDLVLRAPGAVLATSSRADQWRQTVATREHSGPVLVLDADGHGPGTNFGWNPADGCANPIVAMRRAGDFMHASPRDPGGKDSWHEDRGKRLMQLAFHAAALTGRDMYQVRQWCQNPDDETFIKALLRPGAARGWADTLEAMLGQEPEFLNSATTSAEAALGWMDDPEMAAVACPDRGGLDIARFLRQERGTIYLIGAARPYGSLTPFFTAFTSEYMEQARHLAERSPDGRLPVPMTLALDEAATTARVDLARWLAVTAGYNITAVVGLQAFSQLEANWGGPAQAEIILNLLSTKIIGGGVTSPADLDRLSTICGSHRVWRKEAGHRVHEQVPVFPPERIRLLDDLHALVVHRNAKSLEVRVPAVWENPAYAPVTLADPEPELEPAAEPAPAVAEFPAPAPYPVGLADAS
jgi:type IV secretion system protein VirD4